MEKIACCIYYDNEKYEELAKKAYSSFRYFHPEIDCHLFDTNDLLAMLYREDLEYFSKSAGLRKLGFVHFLLTFMNYDKVISLGADTITTARLDEFLGTEKDIAASLNYPFQYDNKETGTKSPDSETNLNVDVVCFTNAKCVQDILNIGLRNPGLWEQAGLNEVVWSGNYNYTYEIVDYPYKESKVVYNVRAKGNISDPDGSKPWAEYIKQWRAADGKLYSHDDKQIKVIHYGEGFFTVPKSTVENILNKWQNWFSKDVKEFIYKL